MMRLRVTASTEQATVLLDRYATLAGELAGIEANRSAALAATNAVADTLAQPVIDELQALKAQLEPWWARAADKLTDAKRKSIELGGCIIGTRLGNARLVFSDGDDKAALAALKELRWGKAYIRVTEALDKTATRKGLSGKHGEGLTLLGFGTAQSETFFVERVEQAGVCTA